MDIITSHINADFDAFASMVAAKKLYPDALIVFPGSQERKLRDFIEVFDLAGITRIKDVEISKINRLIIVDTKRRDRIGPLEAALSNKGLKVHIYDHHPFEKDDIRGETEKIEEVGATATIFTEMLKNRRMLPSPMEATLLALGIYEETGSLQFPSTTERDLVAVSYLLKRGANLNIVSSYLKMDLSMDELDLLNELVKSSEETIIRGVRIGITKASREFYVGDAAHLAHRIMDMEDFDAVVLILDMEGKILIIGRSRARELDVAQLLKSFGGGGHPTAASATVRESSVSMVADRIRQILPDLVRPGKVASDVMTRPVITIPRERTIKEAEDMMTRYGVNVLPVLKDGNYSGLISREIVEKAIYHGLRKNSCMDFSSSDAAAVGPDAPVRDIEKIMIEQNQRFMPVIEKGKIIGAITRTDLLRALYEEFLRKRKIGREETYERTAPGRNLASWLRERFPDSVYGLLKSAGEIADVMGYQVYLVGGSVRDLLLGQENLDIDLVIEGDGLAFARELGKKLNVKVRSHERFGTAHVSIKGLELDVATARTEYYESPAALPKVETSSIKKDLYRRDFTINALAVKLNPKDFGQLIDFFGGQRDLREKNIRVLHNLSYVEDPTRAFRAVRFAERFGFRLSRHTENLIKSAIQMELFDKLSGSRLYDELILAFSETNTSKTLKRLSDFGLLKVIHKNLAFDDRLDVTLSSVTETLAWYNLLYLQEKADKGKLYLMALLSNLSDQDRKGALERLAAPPKTKELIMKSMDESAGILRRLPLRDQASVYHLLKAPDLNIVLFAMSITRDTEVKREISHFLMETSRIHTVLRGSDLKKLGIPQGPVYTEIFRALLDERIRGRLKTGEDEEKYVEKHFRTAIVKNQ